jgi:hypothetical protein
VFAAFPDVRRIAKWWPHCQTFATFLLTAIKLLLQRFPLGVIHSFAQITRLPNLLVRPLLKN